MFSPVFLKADLALGCLSPNTLAINTPNSITGDSIDNIVITYYNDSGTISSPDTVTQDFATGAPPWTSHVYNQMLFFGCYPCNLENWSSNYAAAVTAGLTYYTIKARNSTGLQILDTMTIHLTFPTEKGYEPIRLSWLNQ